MYERRRYVQVGLGSRSAMYREALSGRFSENHELVALCDSNAGRLRLATEQIRATTGIELPGYSSDAFDRMIRETRPDCVIVTSMDRTHSPYICRAMESGCDVITEKPMTIDAEQCRRILGTQRRTGRACLVTFNYRFSPPRTQVKDLLMSGVIGEVLSVDFHWLLDTGHGADYFRRWHRRKENSGGLLVHKATHHFDLVNWWLSSVPETVFAEGRRTFYRPATGDRYGLRNRASRCHRCHAASKCPFYLDLNASEEMRRLYLECEEYDGYYRDQCVFSPDIDIEDSMNAVVTYANGAVMTYSLNAYSPWEGYTVTFNGTRGRLEHTCEETAYISGDGSVPGASKRDGLAIRVCPHWKPAYEVEIRTTGGGHGGGDALLLDHLFGANTDSDSYLRAADHRAGAWSILTGIAANRSIEEKKVIRIDELVPGLEMPDYPPMPDPNDSLPLPALL